MKSLNFLFVFLGLPAWLVAQQLHLDAEIRPRTEYAHGLKTLADKNQDPGFFTTQRTRIGLLFQDKRIQSRIMLQDVRTWGNQPQLVSNEDKATSIHEAWFRMALDTLDRWHLKGGRQEIIYDDQRMFGNVGWAQQARSHDAFLLQYQQNRTRMDIGLAFNQPKSQLTSTYYDIPGNYKTLQYLWFHQGLSPTLDMSLLFINQGLQVSNSTASKTRFNQTAGTHLNYQKNKWKVTLRVYLQFGDAPVFDERDLSAYMHGLDITYRAGKYWNPTLGYEVLSGNDPDKAGKQGAFTPFFGTNHKFNGHMDYFYVGNHLNSTGLIDLYLKTVFPLEKTKLGVNIHHFRSQQAIPDPGGPSKKLSKSLGTELDLSVTHQINAMASVQAGYSQMFGTSTMEILKGGNKDATSNWFYVMFTVKPGFSLMR